MSKPMPSTGKTGQPAFLRLPPNRTCGGPAKIDANDPERTWHIMNLLGIKAGIGVRIIVFSLHQFLPANSLHRTLAFLRRLMPGQIFAT